MLYAHRCDCGMHYEVTEQLAGRSVPCACGRIVSVPSWSRLQQAGVESSLPRGVLVEVRRRIATGELPAGSICPLTGWIADTTVELRANLLGQHSSQTRSIARMAGHLVLHLVFGWIAVLVLSREGNTPAAPRRELWVDLPVRVAAEARRRLLRCRSQRKLRTILRRTPIYAQLLKEYPTARIKPVR